MIQTFPLTETNDFGINWIIPTNILKELAMPIEKVCVVCGQKFKVPPVRELTAKTCSNKCAISVRAKSRERKVPKICQLCGKRFEVPQSHTDRHNYCSLKCRYESPEYRKSVSERMKGENGPNWKGGEPVHAEGYILKHVPEHPFARNGYVFKHRLIMEAWLREENPESEYLVWLGEQLYLSPEASIHHLDEIKKNNRRRNLMVCWRSVHMALHNGKEPKPGAYWPPNVKIKLGDKAKHLHKPKTLTNLPDFMKGVKSHE
jgi:hypothetical protein